MSYERNRQKFCSLHEVVWNVEIQVGLSSNGVHKELKQRQKLNRNSQK